VEAIVTIARHTSTASSVEVINGSVTVTTHVTGIVTIVTVSWWTSFAHSGSSIIEISSVSSHVTLVTSNAISLRVNWSTSINHEIRISRTVITLCDRKIPEVLIHTFIITHLATSIVEQTTYARHAHV